MRTFGLTAVVDGLGHHRLQSSGEASVAVGQERREHEADHAEVHLLGLVGCGAADHASLVIWKKTNWTKSVRNANEASRMERKTAQDEFSHTPGR